MAFGCGAATIRSCRFPVNEPNHSASGVRKTTLDETALTDEQIDHEASQRDISTRIIFFSLVFTMGSY